VYIFCPRGSDYVTSVTSDAGYRTIVYSVANCSCVASYSLILMDVKTVLTLCIAVSLCDGDDCPSQLYLLDLYDCIDDYEDHCHNIPEFTIRAAIELANNRTDILPGYTLHSPSNATSSVGSIKSGEVYIAI